MLNYVETASRSTIVPLTPVLGSPSQEHRVEPPPAMAPLQDHPDWSIDETFGELCYQGQRGEIRVPGMMWMGCDAAFAQGFWRGRTLMLGHEEDNWILLTDQQFTDLIAQELPATLPAVALVPWKQGFIFGWCMTWYYQPILDEEAEAYGEDESEAASCEAMY